VRRIACSLLLLAAGCCVLAAQSGVVRSDGQPIPGATVTVTNGGKTFSTVTDTNGRYQFPPFGSGPSTVEIRMFGFDPLKQQVDFSASKTANFELKLTVSPMAQRLLGLARRQSGEGEQGLSAAPQLPGAGGAPGASAQAALQAALNGGEPAQFTPSLPASGGENSESFLVSGSLSQGLAQNARPDTNGFGLSGFGGGPSPGMSAASGGDFGSENEQGSGGQSPGIAGGFAGRGGGPGGGGRGGFGGPGGGGFGGPGRGPRGNSRFRGTNFGNHRRPSQIHGMASFQLSNSAVNAKPFSITGQDVVQPSYAQSRFSLILGGPLMIPKLVKDPSTFFFISYFGTRNRNPYSAVATVPTELERGGDFSQSVQSGGPLQIFDPATHQPFPGNVIPANRLNPIALSLLRYVPLPNQPGLVNNYQFLYSPAQNTDNFGLRLQRNMGTKDRLAYQLNYQNRASQQAQTYQFLDSLDGTGIRTGLTWTHNLTPLALNSLQFTFNRNSNQALPFFANGADVAAELGIQGTSTNPLNYGPPNLSFTNFGSLTDSSFTLTRNQSQALGDSVVMTKGQHTISFGVQFQRNDLSTETDQNGRGAFTFTGLATSAIGANGQPVANTGFDFADYLLGLPQQASITYGNSSLYFNQNVWSAYVQDDFRVLPSFTVLVGLRYEYFQPFQEKYGVLTNLDIAPGFTGAAVVTPQSIVGPYTGAFPIGLINSDYNNFGPRVGLAWKVPGIKRSTVIRAGYGIYYNGQAYNQFALRLAQQPPFAVSNNIVSSAANDLTLQTGLLGVVPGKNTLNTYAVNRFYKTPYAQTWNFSIQHELGRGMFVEGTYLGTKGTYLDVYTSPNSAPPGTPLNSENRLPIPNATTFTFDTPVGNSSYNGAQLRFSERFNRGLSFRATYTFSKSIDDASVFAGTVAQNYRDIGAERGLSSFDHRHVFDMNWVLSSRYGVNRTSFTARLLRDWTLSGGITAETGSPLTAQILGNQANIAGSGNVGSGRADATGESLASSSYLFNPAAFTLPLPGQYGNAGRNTIPGPGLFSVNAAFGRSFQFGDTRRRLEFRAQATNLFNNVNYSSYNTVVNATNYGLATGAEAMRSLSLVVRFRF
jgi:hypothetical protein